MTSQLTTDDPFHIDAYRHELARAGASAQLLDSYRAGAFPELPEMSSTELWDQMPDYAEAPPFRLRRLHRVAARLPDTGRILDIGAGWGEIIPLVTANGLREYVGLDFSAPMLEQVARKYPDVQMIHGDLTAVDGKFDAIMALEVCEHIVAHKVMNFYRQIAALLKDDGRLLISVPVYENLKSMTLRCPGCGNWHNRMGHVRSYTPELIVNELEIAGFLVRDTEFIYAHFSTSLPGTAKRWLADVGRRLLGMGDTKPLNIIVEATKRPVQSLSPGK